MSKIASVIDDFMDIRAYVSHTLLLHRLTLGMSSPAKARLRLQDAAVWPLVHRELLRFCDLSNTLYGLVSGHMDQVVVQLRESAGALSKSRDELVLKQDDGAYEMFFRLASHDIHEHFVAVRKVWDKEIPDYNEEASLRVTCNFGPDVWAERVRVALREELAPVVASLHGSEAIGEAPAAYGDFWNKVEDLYMMTRVAVVASALQGGQKEPLLAIRGLQRLLRNTEGVVSSWGSMVAPDERSQVVAAQLQTMGLTSLDELVSRLQAGGVTVNETGERPMEIGN